MQVLKMMLENEEEDNVRTPSSSEDEAEKERLDITKKCQYNLTTFKAIVKFKRMLERARERLSQRKSVQLDFQQKMKFFVKNLVDTKQKELHHPSLFAESIKAEDLSSSEDSSLKLDLNKS